MSPTAPTPVTSRRFRFDGEIYEFATSSDVTLRDLLSLEVETRDLGHALNMGEIVRLGEKFRGLTPAEAKVDPESAWMLGITIWLGVVAKRRRVGDLTPVPFAVVLDAGLGTFQPVTETADHQDPQTPRPAPRKASGRGKSAASRKR